MGTVQIHVPACAGQAARSLVLGAGEVARFGRGEPQCPVDVELRDSAVPRVAGEIRCTGTDWQLSNVSRDRSLLVENPEGAGEYFRVAPGRLFAPVPFEFSRVSLAVRSGTVSFQVYAPDHPYLDARCGTVLPGTATVNPFSLDERSRYFLVLVALCEHRLKDVSAVTVPTTADVVTRLGQQMSASAVTFHIDYLADTKLRLKPPARHGPAWKRESLVSVALRFGLVREKHLTLLSAAAMAGLPG
jgi:hypothetical protein